ncbi:hypothetical protein [Lutimonas sp.]|uniref:hypothetical protein n=1 Tax=Lutimonas sp. TaxID=1872403 RepID=UPI003D9B0F50
MKKLTKKSLLLSLLFVSMFSFASTNNLKDKEKEPKVTVVSFKEVKLGSKLSIKDVNGLTLYKESIQESGEYSKGFDLTSLPNGEYIFELDSKLKITILPFNVVSNQVAFKKEEESIIYKPFVRMKDSHVYVSRISFEKSPLKFKIYFQDNYELVLSEMFENESGVNRIYDFSTSKKGNYVFVFKSNGRTFTHIVKI